MLDLRSLWVSGRVSSLDSLYLLTRSDPLKTDDTFDIYCLATGVSRREATEAGTTL